jgi:hypothetical protein
MTRLYPVSLRWLQHVIDRRRRGAGVEQTQTFAAGRCSRHERQQSRYCRRPTQGKGVAAGFPSCELTLPTLTFLMTFAKWKSTS